MSSAITPTQSPRYKLSQIRLRDLSAEVAPWIAEWTAVEQDGWIDRTEKGATTPTQNNAMIALSKHPLLKDCLGWSYLDEDVMLLRPLPCIGDMNPPDGTGKSYPRTAAEVDTIWLTACVSRAFGGISFKKATIADAMQVVAHQAAYNPIESYLKSLAWDGVPRAFEWLHKTLGAKDDDLTSAMGTKFLIGAVRRGIRREGHKFDSMLILEGPKGIQKSTVCRDLFGDSYFLEGVGSITSPNLPEVLSGMWGVEIPELKGFRNASAEAQKEFLSKVVDTYRRPYAVRASNHSRRCVFIGTVNDTQYLQEEEIDRRFWCVECNTHGSTDLEWLRTNRDQLWAEAYHLAMNGEPDFLDPTEMREMAGPQKARVIGDPWKDAIINWLETTNPPPDMLLTQQSIAVTALDIPMSQQNHATTVRIGRIMKELGYVGTRPRSDDGTRGKAYRKA